MGTPPMSSSFLLLQVAFVLISPGLTPYGGKGQVEAARILGIFPTPSISHQLPFQALMKELAARGHEITVLSPNPLKETVANYSDVDLSFSYETFRKNLNFVAMRNTGPLTIMKESSSIFPLIVGEQFESKQMTQFLRENENRKFDLVFLEWICYEAYFGLIHAIGSPPIVGILSLGASGNVMDAIGNPDNPAVNPLAFLAYTDKMTFWERAYNTYVYLRLQHMWHTEFIPRQEDLMRKHFGSAPPSVWETEYNMSLLILNNHWITEYPRALLPNVVSLTGLHVKEKPEPLPKDLQQWLDEATEGVVYFSLGSNVQSRDLPPPLRDAILRALARLPQRVLWKFEDDTLPGKPPNVRISKWLPQQSVLAHPNVRLFITQGGLQSFQEAVYHAVPLLAMPFLGDQQFNAAKMESVGVGRQLTISTLREETFYSTITTMIEDKGYKERMKDLSAEFREHKATSVDTAIWWIEYVLRHNGAPHLRSAALNLRWYEYLLLDVAAVLLVTVAVFLWAVYAVCRKLFMRKRKIVKDTAVKKRQ